MEKESLFDKLIDGIASQMDYDFSQEDKMLSNENEGKKTKDQPHLETPKNTKKEVKENEFGDKMGKSEFCQGVLLFLGSVGLVSLALVRGCQEVKKHQNKVVEPQKVIQVQNTR